MHTGLQFGASIKFNETIDLVQVSESALMMVFANSSKPLSSLQKSEVMHNCLHCIKQACMTLPSLTGLDYKADNEAEKGIYITDTVLSYESLLIAFDQTKIDFYNMANWLKSLPKVINSQTTFTHHKIQVCYHMSSTEQPNDIQLVSEHTGLSIPQIISLHQQHQYRVYAIGFMPNFAYLGELHIDLHTPRLAKPRLAVPSGAVAIADTQTAVYPSKSPGGWHIIGYTHFNFSEPQNVFEVGDIVEFEAIDLDSFSAENEIY